MASRPNRDVTRQNKASSVVKATIFSQILNEALESILHITESILTSQQHIHEYSQICPQLNMIAELTSICVESNTVSSTHYMKSSTYVKCGAKEIATNENSSIKRAIKFKETNDLSESLDHFTPRMLEMHKILHYAVNYYRQEKSDKDTCTQSNVDRCNTVTTSNDTVNEVPESTTPISPQHSPIPPSSLNSMQFSLPPPPNNNQYLSPLQLVLFILKFADNKYRYILDLPKHSRSNNYQKRRVSESLIINIIISKNYIPINRSSAYVLLKQYKTNGKLRHSNWSDKCKPGPKPLFSKSC